MRKTKIIATLGPATDDPAALKQMIAAGVNVVRLNFSHGTRELHLARCSAARKVADESGCPIAVLADFQGPKIRTGKIANEPATLTKGERFVITADDVAGDARRVSTGHKSLPSETHEGALILLDDGKIRLQVEAVEGSEILTRVLHGGWLFSNKAINLPGVRLNTPSLTEKDRADLAFAMEEMRVDYCALSFVRSPDDVVSLKDAIREDGGRVNVIVKVEKPQAVERIGEILSVLELGDGLMVARGDLGVECEIRKVPALQKMLLRRADELGLLCITATQMLESMIDGAMPSRAEVSDIFNSILDGTDAAMLSGETAVGRDPAGAVSMMAEIILEAEKYMLANPTTRAKALFEDDTFELAICKAAAGAAADAHARGIVALTRSGRTALVMSKVEVPIDIPFFALTTQTETFSKMALYYGVRPILLGQDFEQSEDFWGAVDGALLQTGELNKGDTVVFASGFQLSRGATNVCKIVRLGEHENY
ncbi:MAG TPA: pyruvate kinase [Acidobacteriota bacterium]|nr:pyruvate kinase [Acidobacteriota bacterium]